ncbi:cbb3-type cytochrome c oxidase subunit II [Arenicella chitinivorans]|uniref:Cbb3-type cytochrome c oxidase subunit II n=1 Tax=Arenicella chitinivorans TaxID=1329800 RepID=A0A918RZZ6_9GAMM|nr:cbb3-type cytochrome c oxidase subunit II [Arenicella chitinivorans]
MIKHETIEKNTGLMGVLIALVISVAGIAEIVPLMFQAQTTQPAAGVVPYPALELAGRDVYVKEGCYNCHSQMIRPFVSESLRYGPPSMAGESVYDRPFQWGSKRTGPDLARVGGRYTDEWHLAHLINPRDLVPESNMPGFPWLLDNEIDGGLVTKKMKTLRFLGHPYTEEQIAAAKEAVEGRTEMEALIAYLQFLGVANNGRAQQ